MSFSITIRAEGTKEIQDAFERVSKVGGNPRRPLGQTGIRVRSNAVRRLRSRPREWGPTSGLLGSSLALEVGEASVRVGSNLPYAAIQHLGGYVTPKGHKFLAIPVDISARRQGHWPRDYPKDALKYKPDCDIRIGAHSWTGPGLVENQPGKKPRGKKGKKDGDDGTADADTGPRVIFALVTHVNIKGRPYLLFEAEEQQFCLRAFEAEYRRAIEGKG